MIILPTSVQISKEGLARLSCELAGSTVPSIFNSVVWTSASATASSYSAIIRKMTVDMYASRDANAVESRGPKVGSFVTSPVHGRGSRQSKAITRALNANDSLDLPTEPSKPAVAKEAGTFGINLQCTHKSETIDHSKHSKGRQAGWQAGWQADKQAER